MPFHMAIIHVKVIVFATNYFQVCDNTEQMHVTEVSKSLTGGDLMEDVCEIVVLSDKCVKTLGIANCRVSSDHFDT